MAVIQCVNCCQHFMKMDSPQNGLRGMKQINGDFYVNKQIKLGEGNFGSVYKGYNLTNNHIIAVKFVDKVRLEKFPDHNRQITVMEDLAKIFHPNIMGYYGYSNSPEGLYFFIEYCSGGNLKDLSRSGISELRCIKLFEQLLDAMIYMNERNKVHRDLKPENVLLDDNQELKIADFGLARDLQIQMTKGVCTPLYAAPEVLKHQPYNSKCDVWSAGLILFEMLTGKEMFSHIKMKLQLVREVESFAISKKNLRIPNHLNKIWEQLILQMMTFDVAERPTFKELRASFEKIRPILEKQLMTKYDEEKVDEAEQHIRLTKKISPYHSNPTKAENGFVEMAKKLQEQSSFIKLNTVRKWLLFIKQKTDIMPKLIKQFNRSQYLYIKNVHKYILMFLSICMYVTRLRKLLEDTTLSKVVTPDCTVTEKDICSSHKDEYNAIVKENIEKIKLYAEKYEDILQNQVVVKIMSTYIKREEEGKIIGQLDNLKTLLKDVKNNKFYREEDYTLLYRKMSEADNIKYHDSVLKDFNQDDLRVYAYIQVVGHIDKVFNNSYYSREDYMRARKQHMENANKDELMYMIKASY